MPTYREPVGRNKVRRRFRITARAKFPSIMFGEMAASDWLGPSSKPDRPLYWDARVMIVNDYPLVKYPGGFAGFILWPDGSTNDVTPMT
jgi:hypothetical protein